MNTLPHLPEARLNSHLSELRRRPMAAATRERLAQAMLDWFTAGRAALGMPEVATMRAVAESSLPGEGPAPVFGGGAPVLPLAAAFANAAIAHLREIDDAHRAAMLHPGVVAISPVLALAAAMPLARRQVADAVIAGYEVALRVGEALGTRHAAGFHATATAGTVGAAAASGVALGLDEGQLHHAMGIAATQAAGLWQMVDDGAHASKSLHPAFAVRNGLMAAYAARAGLPGARAYITGPRGMHALLAGDGPLSALDTGFETERINSTTIKAWPCCAQLFTPLDATLELLEAHRPALDDIESLEVLIFPHALKIAGVVWPTQPAEAPFSLRYVLATLLATGGLSIFDIESTAFNSSQLKALAGRIHVTTSETFQQLFPHKRPSRVTLTLKGGARITAYRELRRGDPEDPYTWPQLQARLRRFVPTLADTEADDLARWCRSFTDPGGDTTRCHPAQALFGNTP